ncbi:prenyltransferase/squalene oxidase repeat-containing protein [Streptomyces sp. WAC01280]|uniref:prenyltransferase/squalene oxidase repeat-containing protein n=1 Tax=Streptomyces sp. WAC01280 TaxID=2487424 RepID=UPI000F79B3E0|nr:prenyltransferase/squalene oxidase repeat-containing protein [Streptomyces sp. WAC01280]RSS59177.1 peptidase [Streptomyces sp. WAC01280]
MDSGQATRRRTGTGGRFVALATAALLTSGFGVTFLTSAPVAQADPIEQCTATTGAIVAVDFGPFGGDVERGCDATPATGYELLWSGGFTTEGTVHDGPAFLCRIGHGGFAGGTRFPTPATEACGITPPATAYWSYWTASPGQKKWKYSNYGAMARQLKPGDVDAWVFGATDIGGTTGGPRFSPDDIRAGASGPAPDPSQPPVPQVPGAEVDLAAATRWLTGRLKDGERVVDEIDAYLSYQATAEDVLTLAAVAPESPAAAKPAGVLGRPEHTDAYAYPDGADKAPNSTAAARLALVAEATGGDPRAFGGHDLLDDLVKNVCTTGPSETSPNCSAPGDFPVTGRAAGKAEGQALTVIALTGGGVKPPAEAVRRLADLQCEDGGFTSMLIRPGESCESEAGATGLAVMALLRAGGHSQAVTDGRAYLRKAQSDMATGGLPAVYYAMVSSPYATGLAAQALRALGDTVQADAAVSWLSGQQLPEGGFSFEEEDPTARIAATGPAVIAGARTDLLRLTAGETTPPTFPTPTPTTPTPTPTPTTPTPTPTTPSPTPTTPSPTTTTPGPVMPSGPAPDLAKATSYLTDHSRLLQGRYYASDPTGRADFGLTIDLVYALAATGTHDPALRGIVDFLDERGQDAVGRDLTKYTGVGTAHPVGGAIGKTALAAQSVGRDARDFAGQDLIRALADETCAAKTPDTGRPCADKGAYTNASSVFDQSLGVIAQLRAGETAAAAGPASYLKSLQRASGAWGSMLVVRSGDEVDSTAMAAMAVDLLPDAESQAAVDKAIAWLAGQQYADGGFPGASGNSVNSTALAIQGLALDASKYQAQIAKARAFLLSQQNTDGGFATSKGDTQGSDVRASTQALGGTDGVSFAVLDRDLSGTTPQPTPTGTTPQPTPSDTTAQPTPSDTATASPSSSPSSSSSATAPVIITPGEDGGTSGGTGTAGGSEGTTGGSGGPEGTTGTNGGNGSDGGIGGGSDGAGTTGGPGSGGGGNLAATGVRPLGIAAAAALLALGGLAVTRTARRHRTNAGEPR